MGIVTTRRRCLLRIRRIPVACSAIGCRPGGDALDVTAALARALLLAVRVDAWSAVSQRRVSTVRVATPAEKADLARSQIGSTRCKFFRFEGSILRVCLQRFASCSATQS